MLLSDAEARATRVLPESPAGLAEAAGLLRAGALVAFPTETVYGLGADAANPEAVARLYAAKGRPAFNPLIAHLPDRAAAAREALFDARAAALAEAFWPGPLTLVAPVAPRGNVCELARAGLSTLALRVPGHERARMFLQEVGRPVVAPSANISGRVSPATIAHVLEDLDGRIAAAVDGGPVRVGVESTIVACLGGVCTLLRPGGLAREAIESVVGPLAAPQIRERDAERDKAGCAPSGIQAPGMLASHYAPNAPVRLNAKDVRPGEVGLDFGGRLPGAALDLSPGGDVVEAASRLYLFLRRLDAARPAGIAVAPVPAQGLGEAIVDRLRRAAAPRG